MKLKLFRRLKAIHLLKQRALDKDEVKKYTALQKRAELIEYYLDSQPIIDRDIIMQ